MPHCQELKNQLAEIKGSLSGMKELLNEYKESGDEEIRGRLKENEAGINKLEKLEDDLQKAVNELISHHPHAEEFEGKLKVRNGRVVCTDDIDFRHEEHVYLPSLIEVVEGYLDLYSLTSAEHLDFPDTIERSLYLENLTSVENLDLPDTVGGYLGLKNLNSAEHLDLPDTIGKDLNLDSLISVEHLDLPDTIERSLHLKNLNSTEHLDLDGVHVGNNIYLNSLSQEQRDELKEEYSRLADKITTLYY